MVQVVEDLVEASASKIDEAFYKAKDRNLVLSLSIRLRPNPAARGGGLSVESGLSFTVEKHKSATGGTTFAGKDYEAGSGPEF